MVKAADDASGSAQHVSERIEIAFDGALYSIDAIQRAAIKFTNLCSFEFLTRENRLIVVVSALTPSVNVDCNSFVAIFRNEVLDQLLRARISKETEAERNLILAYAFSNTKLVES